MSVDISIVIPCRNAAGTIGRQLKAILHQQTEARFEVIVADNGSTDHLANAVAPWQGGHVSVFVVDAGALAGVNAARNVGVRASNAPFILLCDADDIVQQGWLDAHWVAFCRGASCVSGGLIRVAGSRTVDTWDDEFRFSPRDPPHAVGANCGFTRKAYDSVGGFDESLFGGSDETDFFWRLALAGFPVTHVEKALVQYTLRERLSDVLRQHYRYGIGQARLVAKHRETRPISPTLPRTLVSVAFGALRLGVVWDWRARRRGAERLGVGLGELREVTRRRMREGWVRRS